MRILNVILSMGGGGTERQVASIVTDLCRRGHDVHVAYVYGGVYLERLAAVHCQRHRVVASSKHDPRVFLRLLHLARRLRPDLVHTWLPHMDIVGGVTARRLGIPWVMSERSSAGLYSSSWLNRARVMLGRRADRIVANSRGGSEYWETLGVPSSRIEVIPNFVPHEEIDAAPALVDSRIEPDDELVVYVGRLSPDKNLPNVIAAIEEVAQRRPRIKLALCGEGPLRNSLIAQVDAGCLGKRVVFTGFVPNVASWLKRANAVVAVSSCEGHPNAVLEAMAAGSPLVISDIPAHRRMLDERSARFVPVNDSSKIAAALEETIEKRREALLRSARARQSVASLTLAGTVGRYEDVYREVIAR